MEDHELLAAAHHEAGHVVVAHSLDCQVIEMKLYWGNLERWFGRSPLSLSKEKLTDAQVEAQKAALSVKGAKAALAGMLAQTKFLATRQLGKKVRFDENADLKNMGLFLKDNMRTEESPGCIGIDFMIEPTDEKLRIDFSGLCFSTADSKLFNEYLSTSRGETALALARETMRLIDNEAIWARIETLASLVSNQPPVGTNQQRSLNAEQILEALSS